MRQTEIEDSAHLTLDSLAARVSHDPRLNGPEFRPLRKDLLHSALGHWDEAIRIDTAPRGTPGARTPFYRRQRALCLARFGEHEAAASEAKALGTETSVEEGSGEAAYDLSRVYSVCSGAARDDPSLAAAYADRAMEFLRAADRTGHFKSATLAVPLGEDPDFAPLQPREDFREWLRTLKVKAR
jgi:hypothetical protein